MLSNWVRVLLRHSVVVAGQCTFGSMQFQPNQLYEISNSRKDYAIPLPIWK